MKHSSSHGTGQPKPRMNVATGAVYDAVHIPAEYGYYGRIEGLSANAMYNKYLAWFMGQYGTSKTPMVFKEWIKWAKQKKLVLNAGGPDEPSEEVKAAAKEAMGTGKKIAIAVLVVMAAAILIKMAKPLTNQAAEATPAI